MSRLIVTLLILFTTACASHSVKSVEIRQADSYPNYQEKDNIGMAADIFSEAEKTKNAFDQNLNESGYFPVHLIVKNESDNKLILHKNSVKIKDRIGNEYFPTSCSAMIDSFQRNKMAYALLGFGIFSYMSAEDANKKMAEDWKSKELADEVIIMPRKMQSGFIYFKLPQDCSPDGMLMDIRVEHVSNGNNTDFELLLK